MKTAAPLEVSEFTGTGAVALTSFYSNAKVEGKTVSEKVAALEANLGHFGFFAYGGEETEIMKLRAAERVYLFRQRIPVQ
jgi:predicted alpha/beta hydrolase